MCEVCILVNKLLHSGFWLIHHVTNHWRQGGTLSGLRITDQQSGSQSWSRKDSMRLWLNEERKESSSSSEKQICLPVSHSISVKFLRLFLEICPTSDPSSGFSRATEEPFEGVDEVRRLAGRRGLAMFFWGKDATVSSTVSPSHIALMLRKRKCFE